MDGRFGPPPERLEFNWGLDGCRNLYHNVRNFRVQLKHEVGKRQFRGHVFTGRLPDQYWVFSAFAGDTRFREFDLEAINIQDALRILHTLDAFIHSPVDKLAV